MSETKKQYVRVDQVRSSGTTMKHPRVRVWTPDPAKGQQVAREWEADDDGRVVPTERNQ